MNTFFDDFAINFSRNEIKKEIESLKKSFFYDLELYKETKKEIYLKCAIFTLNKIKENGYKTLYEELKEGVKNEIL